MTRALLVVAAVLVRDGRVFAARRRGGGWEFPGGKVEAGEGCASALERELHEELDIAVRAERELAAVAHGGVELRLWLVRLLGAPPTASTDHDELRWLGADELDALDWLAADRELLPAVRPLLATRESG
jgi:8-oxo-dGTP diphosphatase